MTKSAIQVWLQHLTWQIKFARNHGHQRRRDGLNDWEWFERTTRCEPYSLKGVAKRFLEKTGYRERPAPSLRWLHENAERLWSTRCLFEDELSRLLFDSSLVLRCTNHRQFYFPRIEFENLIEVCHAEPFQSNELPQDYLGLPLLVADLNLRMPHAARRSCRVILASGTVDALNNFQQYFITRDRISWAPRPGECVLDCGACIGDVSVLFSAMVGENGQVHAFDPLPLHNHFCAQQKLLNPSLTPALHFNTLAVDAHTSAASGRTDEGAQIDPGLRADSESFDCTSLDDYVATRSLSKVDFIKMDIEGAEMAALDGARDTLKRFAPRLAISGYHKPADLWEIPDRIKTLNPDYRLYFSHHSPVQWESVFYAVA